MKMKKILGLDLGSNSIGAALINVPESIADFGKEGNIEWVGSRILPVDGEYLQKFESGGQSYTKAATRRIKRGSRRLKHRYKLRRTRLVHVLKILGWIDESFPLDDSKGFKRKINEDESYLKEFHLSKYLPFSNESIEEATELFGVKGQRNKKRNTVIPEDWVIYYLRKKALTKKITLTELARIIYMLNQRRGFKSSRKDLKEDNIEEKKWVEILKIDTVEEINDDVVKRKDGKLTFIIKAGKYQWKVNKKKKPEWEGKEFQLLFTEKNGKINEAPKVPEADDWELLMVALDNQIGDKTPGAFFFDKLVGDKNYKIRQITVKREKYKKELELIWKKQCELNENLRKLNTDTNILQKIAEKLYQTQTISNNTKYKEVLSNDLLHLISDDIIYYQRELKSQKNSIGECQYEKHKGIDGEQYGVKCSPKSSPEFQEFRIWQDIHNIRILEKEQKQEFNGNLISKIDVDVTKQFINTTAKENLFELFDC